MLGVRGQRFDSLALLPQWKFFGQAAIAKRGDTFKDYHLIARFGSGRDDIWQEFGFSDERRWLEAVWNPHSRSTRALYENIDKLCLSVDKKADPNFQTSLAYLTVLRHCLDTIPQNAAKPLQFAVVSTLGRGRRAIAIRFLSAWHTN